MSDNNNFKSIKHIKIDCKRINVLIGKPNVGKSNILEALALYIAPYGIPGKKFLEGYLRYEKISDLIYDLNKKDQVLIKSNLGYVFLKFQTAVLNSYDIIMGEDFDILNAMNQPDTGRSYNDKANFFSNLLKTKGNETSIGLPSTLPYYGYIDGNEILKTLYSYGDLGYNTPVKKYQFKSVIENKNYFPSFLMPPFGANLFDMLESNPDLWEECAGLFNNYGLDLLLDTVEGKLEIQKKVGRKVTKIPYSLTAETLQRYIFHLAAIETNNDSVLLFEEPESHSFPPYISRLSERIIENKTNQYFIATHSQDLLMPFLEQCSWDEIAVFIASYENYETKIKALNNEELQNLLDTGADAFFNLRAFV